MQKYVIERNIPGAGNFSDEELKTISQTSCSVLNGMKQDINWIESYVTGDKVYCIYEASDKDAIIEHARLGNFPANSIEEVRAIIDPSTADK